MTPTITITEWTVQPINPDLTPSTNLPSVTSTSVPPAPGEEINSAAPGQLYQLILECELTGQKPDTTDLTLVGSVVNFSPALFAELNQPYFPTGIFPSGGYGVQMPLTGLGNRSMALVGQGFNQGCNENGSCQLVYVDDYHFNIEYTFRITCDVLTYPQGRVIDNTGRLFRASVVSVKDGDNTASSIYTHQKSLNAFVAIQQEGTKAIAQELMVPFRAGFTEQGIEGSDPGITWNVTVERLANPGVPVDGLSAYEDNVIVVQATETTATMPAADWLTAIVVQRKYAGNRATFETDYALAEARIPHAPAGVLVLDKPISEPSSYIAAGPVKTARFVVLASGLEKGIDYDVILLMDVDDPTHGYRAQATKLQTTRSSATLPTPISFNMQTRIHNRGGQKGDQFTGLIGERLTSVVKIDESQYNVMAGVNGAPFIDFDNDCLSAKVYIQDTDSNEILFEHTISRLPGDPFPTDDEYIGWTDDVTFMYFYLKEFRVPGTNNQGLEDWKDLNIAIGWVVDFIYPDLDFTARYVCKSTLNLRGYENEEVTPKISALQILDPDTGMPAGELCGLSSVLVKGTADPGLVDLPNAYVEIHIDAYPLGTAMYNDYALEDNSHTIPVVYDPGVIFTARITSLVSSESIQPDPVTGEFSCIIDISDLPIGQTWRVYAYIITA